MGVELNMLMLERMVPVERKLRGKKDEISEEMKILRGRRD